MSDNKISFGVCGADIIDVVSHMDSMKHLRIWVGPGDSYIGAVLADDEARQLLTFLQKHFGEKP